jgi:hypothetical protein
VTYRSGPDRKELPMVRPEAVPTPCDKCPKESPEKAKELELSQKNWQALAHYRQATAVGLTDAERGDPIVRRNFAIIARLKEEHDALRQARYLADQLAEVLLVRASKR